MSESCRPAGFRFYPTEEELICFYLHHQLQGNAGNTIHQVIPVLDIYDKDPSKLQSLAGEVCREDPEQWFFFVPRQEREAQGGRPSRSTGLGYWKGTGSPSHVYSSLNSGVIGVKRTMVFYQGRPPNGRKTKWKMNEYRAIVMGQSTTDGVGVGHNNNSVVPQLRNEFSLCRVYVVSGMKSRAFDRRPPEAEGGYVGPPLSGGGSREQGGSSRQGANLKDQRSMELISNPIVTPETTTSTQLDDSVWDSDWEFPDLDPLDRLIT